MPSSPSSAIRIAGRWWRSAIREATIPITPGCQPSAASTSARPVGMLGDQRLGLEADPRLDVAALGVDRVELGGHGAARARGPRSAAARARRRRGSRRPAAFSRGPSRKPIARLVEPARVHARDVHQRAQADLARARPARAGPARTSRRFSPSSGTTSATVASATRSRSSSASAGSSPAPLEQRLRELVRDAGRAQVRARVAVEPRVHERRVRQRAVGARRCGGR